MDGEKTEWGVGGKVEGFVEGENNEWGRGKTRMGEE